MLMWAAGAGSQCACATPRGANHRPRNGSCARSQLVGHHNLAKMEEESFRVERDLPFPSRSILVLRRFVSPPSSSPSPRRSRRRSSRTRLLAGGEIHVSLPCPTSSSHANEHDSSTRRNRISNSLGFGIGRDQFFDKIKREEEEAKRKKEVYKVIACVNLC